MKLDRFSHNGTIKPISEALFSADRIEHMYGFGVYETLKVRNGIRYFTEQHLDRLFHSACCIDLIHTFTKEMIAQYITDLVQAVNGESLNLKLLLLGAPESADSQLLIFPLAPLFPKKQWYRDGVTVYSSVYERWMPQAKTLNMLPSYYYYTKAQQQGGYDALFIDTEGNLREGTRTNVYLIKGNHIVSPPKRDVLEGVTMMTLERVIRNSPYQLEYRQIPFTSLKEYDGMFLSSTSTKLMPVKQVDDFQFPQIVPALQDLMDLYNRSLEKSQGIFEQL